MVREGPPRPAPPPHDSAPRPTYSADKARGGEIILRTPARRFIFIGGLVAVAVLVLLLRLVV